MSVITPITKLNCPNAHAGLVAVWAVACKDVVDILFDDDNFIYNVILDAGAEWKLIEFEKETGYLFQEKVVVKGYESIVKQSIYFEIHGLSSASRNALEDLNGNCCLNAIAKDKAGNYHYCGISRTEEGYMQEWMMTGDGTSETGADPATDVAKYTESLICTCDFYAMITLDPNTMAPLFWKKPDDNFWTKPDNNFWTIKQ